MSSMRVRASVRVRFRVRVLLLTYHVNVSQVFRAGKLVHYDAELTLQISRASFN